jgi:hypothetical protein
MVQMIVVALNLCDNLSFMGLSRGGLVGAYCFSFLHWSSSRGLREEMNLASDILHPLSICYDKIGIRARDLERYSQR